MINKHFQNLDCQTAVSMKASIKQNNRLSWQSRLMKTFKSNDQLLCSLYCFNTDKCRMASYDSQKNQCEFYGSSFTSQSVLFSSAGTNIIYGIKPDGYSLKGTLNKSIYIGGMVSSLANFQNGNLAIKRKMEI